MAAPNVLPIRKPDPEITAEIVDVTPELARAWLGQNTKNRRTKDRAINAYARDMRAGNWRLTGEAIKFDKSGRMLDGQNRCHAIVRAQVSVKMLVIRGLSPEAQEVMDAGVRRSNSDQLGLHDVPNATAVATIAATWTGYRNGQWKVASAQKTPPALTHSETLQFVKDHPEVADAAKIACRVARVLRLPQGVIGAAWMITSEVDPQAAGVFFDQIANLETTGRGDPIATLLKTVQMDRERSRIPRPAESFYLLFRSWNAWRKGERLTFLRTGARDKLTKETKAYEIPQPR